jgi:hypothetical protein
MTKDESLLEMATECADLAMLASPKAVQPMAFVNLSGLTGKGRPWQNEVPLADLSAGLPELIALYRITNNATYYKRAAQIVSVISATLNSQAVRLDGFSAGHFLNVAIANQFGVFDRLAVEAKRLENLTVWVGANESVLYPLLTAASLSGFQVQSAEQLRESAFERHQPPLYSIFNQGDSRTLLGFRFDGTIPLLMLREAEMEHIARYGRDVAGIVEYSLNYCKHGAGFAGFTRSNADHIVLDNVQHSALFGHWLKAGALIAARQTELTARAIINERGHILSVPVPTTGS